MAGFNNSSNPFQSQVRLGPQYVQLVPGLPGPQGTPGTAGSALWQSGIDLDLTAQANQNFFTDTTYTYAGMTWTKFRSSEDGATASVNGSGLVFQPTLVGGSGAPTGGSANTYPKMHLPLSQIVALANVAPDWPLRFTAVCTISDVVTGSAAMMLWPGVNAAGAYFAVTKNPTTSSNAFSDLASTSASLGGVTYTNATEFAASDTIVMELAGGPSRGACDLLTGAYSAGYPANGALLPAIANGITGASLFNTTNAARLNTWGISLGAWHVSSTATTPLVTFSHLRVEYIPR